ncbi:protoporphyrinogen oxidase [Hoyosella rhizosphaerae]|uniref:Coproporphyrinogen III oxidase n=1 Tax=Hoyosella rhizosphaerae TaxID=1755582 RepID=A0A916U6Q1_9ACTN|nr:protoporphyrinogen oxidase [Hoyosella rhizosphaerae]
MELADELGLVGELVQPGTLRPAIWSESSLHDMPAGAFMGIPLRSNGFTNLLSPAAMKRVEDEPTRPFAWEPGTDVSLADLVGDRFGVEVVRRSVDPLLSGVYGGDTRHIGVRAAIPELARALDGGATSLTEALRAAIVPGPPGPVFAAFRNGYRTLIDALVLKSAADIFLEKRITALRKTTTGWHCDTFGEFDAVIITTPAHALGDIVGEVAPDASQAAASIQHASAALVTFSLPADAEIPPHSGVLVATGEALTAKAFTFTSRKWPHQAHRNLVRVSLGRFGDDPQTSVVAQPDNTVVDLARRDLAAVTGIDKTPRAVHVQRWNAGLPQYEPGHTARVETIEQSINELRGLAVAGGYLHGVGVPACVATANAAVTKVLSDMAG